MKKMRKSIIFLTIIINITFDHGYEHCDHQNYDFKDDETHLGRRGQKRGKGKGAACWLSAIVSLLVVGIVTLYDNGQC